MDGWMDEWMGACLVALCVGTGIFSQVNAWKRMQTHTYTYAA